MTASQSPTAELVSDELLRKERGPEWCAIFDALRDYRLSNMTFEGTDDPFCLVDLVSTIGSDISTGERELLALADEISLAVDASRRSLDTAGDGEPVAPRRFPEPLFAFRDVVENGDGTANLVPSPALSRPMRNTGEPVDDSGIGWGELLAGYQRICAEHGIEPTSRDVLDALARHDAKEPIKPQKPFCYTASLNLGPRPTLASYFQESIFTIPLYASPTPAVQVSDAMVEAARNLVAAKFSTYKARNGRDVGIQDDSGEKCWIVPFDEMFELEAALSLQHSKVD